MDETKRSIYLICIFDAAFVPCIYFEHFPDKIIRVHEEACVFLY